MSPLEGREVLPVPLPGQLDVYDVPELAAARPASLEILDADALLPAAFAVAHRQAAPNTRRAYASAYRAFAAFLLARHPGRPARLEDFTAAAVVAFRDALERDGQASSTIAVRLSALRKAAAELGADPAIAAIKARGVQPDDSPALSLEELDTLLAVPDRRTTRGKRDAAILHLLAFAGLRRSELVALTVFDVEETRRDRDPRRRTAVTPSAAERTHYDVRVRADTAKRGRPRTVPLDRHTVRALIAWHHARPSSEHDSLFVSLPRPGAPKPAALSTRAIGELVSRHGIRARLPEGRRSPHVLRHTFCTMLAERGVPGEIIRDLAGHQDFRTTLGYIRIADERRREAISDTFDQGRSALARASL